MISHGSSFIISTACSPPPGEGCTEAGLLAPLGKPLSAQPGPRGQNEKALRSPTGSSCLFSSSRVRDGSWVRAGTEDHPPRFKGCCLSGLILSEESELSPARAGRSISLSRSLWKQGLWTPVPLQLAPGEVAGNSCPASPRLAAALPCRKMNQHNQGPGGPAGPGNCAAALGLLLMTVANVRAPGLVSPLHSDFSLSSCYTWCLENF